MSGVYRQANHRTARKLKRYKGVVRNVFTASSLYNLKNHFFYFASFTLFTQKK
jgi:hypothetical protein